MCLFHTLLLVNYWVNLSGKTSDFQYLHMQLHSGTFMSCTFSHMPWQSRNRWGKGNPSYGGNAMVMDANHNKTKLKKKKDGARPDVYKVKTASLTVPDNWLSISPSEGADRSSIIPESVQFLKKLACLQTKLFLLLVRYQITHKSIGQAL